VARGRGARRHGGGVRSRSSRFRTGRAGTDLHRLDALPARDANWIETTRRVLADVDRVVHEIEAGDAERRRALDGHARGRPDIPAGSRLLRGGGRAGPRSFLSRARKFVGGGCASLLRLCHLGCSPV
jgi:hypothetical protein